MKITVDQEKCIGCGSCTSMCPECFEMVEGKSQVKSENCDCNDCDLKEVAMNCPGAAISVE